MRQSTALLLFYFAVLMGITRLAGVASEPFQAAAHLFVGGLIGAYLVGRRRAHLVLAVALSVLELGAFLFSRL